MSLRTFYFAGAELTNGAEPGVRLRHYDQALGLKIRSNGCCLRRPVPRFISATSPMSRGCIIRKDVPRGLKEDEAVGEARDVAVLDAYSCPPVEENTGA